MIWAMLDPAASLPDMASFLNGVDDDLDAAGLGSHRFYRQSTSRRATTGS